MIASVGGMSQINDKLFAITVVDANTITLQGTDGTAFSAYTSGGTLTSGTFYALNTTATAKDLTGGNTLATDQWGATGVAAHSTAIVPTFRTDYPQNGFDKRYGKSTNQVLSAATSGDGWTLTGLWPAAVHGHLGRHQWQQPVWSGLFLSVHPAMSSVCSRRELESTARLLGSGLRPGATRGVLE